MTVVSPKPANSSKPSQPSTAGQTGHGATVEAGPLTEPSTSDGIDLPIPDEPEDLKVALRAAILDGQPWAGPPTELDLSVWLWGAWGAKLESLHFGRDQFDRVLAASEREARLWLMGDRQWAQLASGLAGRISRRLPAAPTT
jgi:hypothetical protein